MKLYHGTNARYLGRILKQGIRPRGGGKKDNWKHTVSSNPDAVYLTNAYPLHFMGNACRGGNSDVGAVIEVDTTRLDTTWLVPDEDSLTQAEVASKDSSPATGITLYDKTLWYRQHLWQYAGLGRWQASLQAMGTCCYLGTVPASAITRYVKIPLSKNKHLIWQFDPTISIHNFLILGPMYRAATMALFGDTPDDELQAKLDENPMLYGRWQPNLVDHTIEVVNG